MNKIVILGGGGFIGSSVADKLLSVGYHVRIFEHPRVIPYRIFQTGESIEWMTGDFHNSADVDRALRDTDAVCHLVSSTVPGNSIQNINYDIQSNLTPSVQLLNSMQVHGIHRIVFISSGGAVYGLPRYLPVDESHPTDPVVPYGINKLGIEKYIQMFDYLHGITGIVLRVSNPYGARQRPDSGQGVISAFLHRARRNEKLEIWGDGSVIRDYLYIDDVSDAFLKALAYKGSRRIFNIGSGEGRSLNDIISLIESLTNRKLERNYVSSRPYDVPINILNASLASEELGWSPSVTLSEGLTKMLHELDHTLK